MGIIGNALIVAATSSADMQNPATWLQEWSGGAKTISGVQVNETKAMSISSVFACIRNLAEDEAKLPLPVYEELPNGVKKKRKDHRLYPVLNYNPNPDMTAFNCRQAITACAALYGRGYGKISRNQQGDVLQLIPLHPTRVIPRRDRATKQLHYEIRDIWGSVQEVLFPRDVFELPGFGLNGILGEMITTVGKESLGLAIAADNFASSFFGNGINTGGLLVHPGTPGRDQRQIIRESFDQVHKGAENANKIILTWDGMQFTPTSLDPDKAQAVESRQFQVEEVARWFRMPPDKIGHLLRTKGWNTQELANISYLTDTLMAWFVRWEQEISRKMIRLSEQGKIYAEHLADALLRLDAKTRSIVHQTSLRNGALTLDEWARHENQTPPGGDIGSTRWMMANIVPAGRQLETPAVPAASTPPAAGQMTDDTKAMIMGSMQLVIKDAVVRFLTREAIAIKRSAKKYEKDFDSFKQWIGEFCENHKATIVEFLTPGLTSMQAMIGVGWFTETTESFSREHVFALEYAMIEAFNKGKIIGLCDTLVDDHADRITDYLIRDAANKTLPVKG